MTDINEQFMEAYIAAYSNRTVYYPNFPIEMMASKVDSSGWLDWRPLKGTLTERDYRKMEEKFGVIFPKSFINWHKSFFFFGGDCSLLRLPTSTPTEPLGAIEFNLNWFIPEQLIPHKLYPFADEGNDTGPLVFDGRKPIFNNEFPIRVYDHEYGGELDGLSEIIFSSFTKLLQCLIHYMTELKSRRNYEIIPDFFQIDTEGAGKTGVDYWTGWVNMQKSNFEQLGI